MKKFWLSCVITLAISVFMGMGFAPASGRAESSERAASEEGASESKSGSKKEADSLYVHLQPMVLPIVSGNGAEQIVTLIVDLQMKTPEAVLKINQEMPRVQDSILQELYGGLGDGSLRKGFDVDIPKIKTRIAGALGKIVEKRDIHAVLIKGIAQRKL